MTQHMFWAMESTTKSANDDSIHISKLVRFVETSNLDQSLINKLHRCNLKYKNQLMLLSDQNLQNEYGFTVEDITKINKKFKLSLNNFNAISGTELEKETLYIKSGSNAFDKVFGQGLPTGRLIQIFGEAGVGKSQICFQFCFRVQLPLEEGGLNSEALYLDTEKSFRPERILQIAKNYYNQSTHNDQKFKKVLERIHVRDINTNSDDLCKIIIKGELDSFLDQNTNIKLIILDSIAYHFRYDYEYDTHIRTNQLMKIATKLREIASQKNISILITNQAKFSKTQPALGDLWNSCCSISLLLDRFSTDSVRQCSAIKSLTKKTGFSFKYLIDESGITDYKECENSGEHMFQLSASK